MSCLWKITSGRVSEPSRPGSKAFRKHRGNREFRMNPNKQCRLCNCSFKGKFGKSNISTENRFNPSKRKGCKGEILAKNLQRAGFEVHCSKM